MTLVIVPLRDVRGAGVTAVFAALLLAFSLLAACSPTHKTEKNKAGATILHWYVGPDRVNVDALAQSCSEESGGDFELEVERLPVDSDKRHSLLVRRLSAKDPTIDLLSLDDSFTAEFAEAQLLAPIPDDLVPAYSKDVFPKALKAATFDGSLVAAPWWFDPQLLWYRGTVAERAGLDMTKPVTWENLIAGAQRVGVSVEIDDANGRGLPDWISALVSNGGGTVVEGAGRKATVGLDTAAGEAAAAVVQYYTEAAIGQGPSADALDRFAGTSGGFLLAPSSVVADPVLASVASDMKWAPYPVISKDAASVAPLAGVALAVPLYAPNSELSYKAISCLTGTATMASLMTSAGHSSSRSTTYEAVSRSYPLADVTKAAVIGGAAVPQTPYWQMARAGLLDSWLPLGSVDASTTPVNSQRSVKARLAGELP